MPYTLLADPLPVMLFTPVRLRVVALFSHIAVAAEVSNVKPFIVIASPLALILGRLTTSLTVTALSAATVAL